MKSKKLIAPIVITILMILYIGFFAFAWTFTQLPLLGKIIGMLIPIGFIVVNIFVLIERIKEIRSGEEDDLSKY